MNKTNKSKPHTSKGPFTPPGPNFTWLFNNSVFGELGNIVELAQEYSKICKIPGVIRTYLINHPDYIQHVLHSHIQNYPKGGMALKPVKKTLGQGLVVLEGEAWQKQRRLLAPFFFTKKIAQYVPIINQITIDHIATWETHCKTGEPIDIADEMMCIITKISLKLFFSTTAAEEEIQHLVDLMNIEHKFSTAFSLLPWLPTLNNLRYHKARRYLHNYLKELIQKHVNEPSHYPDMLTTLIQAQQKLQLSEQDIFDEAKTLWGTGTETTAVALAWTLYLLGKEPKSRHKLEQEIKQVLQGRIPDYADTLKLTYTKNVFAESLRLYPPIWLLGRKAIHNDQIDHYFIKAKTDILICPYSIHRDKRFWHNPDAFMPERFSAQSPKPTRYAYIPFSAGPRVCIAGNLATLEAQLILSIIAQRYRLQLIPEHHIALSQYISLKPTYGILAKVERV